MSSDEVYWGSPERAAAARRLRPYLSPEEWEVYGRIRGTVAALNARSPYVTLMSTTVYSGDMSLDDVRVYGRLTRSLPDSWDIGPEEWRLSRV